MIFKDFEGCKGSSSIPVFIIAYCLKILAVRLSGPDFKFASNNV